MTAVQDYHKLMDMEQGIKEQGIQDAAHDFAILGLINRHLCNTADPEERAYAIIRAYVELENPDEELQTEFVRWRHGSNAEAKERAFRTIIEQASQMAEEEGDEQK